MKEGYSQIRNEALAYAFSYMNLIEHWGSGIPRIIGKVKAAGLREPEFIGGEVDLRINIYRGKIDNAIKYSDVNNSFSLMDNSIRVPDTDKTAVENVRIVPDSAVGIPKNGKTVPDTFDKMPDSMCTLPDSINTMPDNKQEQKIYRYVLQNGSITTAEAMDILCVKDRRARAILLNMVEHNFLTKRGAARSTIYVRNA